MYITAASRIGSTRTVFASSSGDVESPSESRTAVAMSIDRTISLSITMSGCSPVGLPTDPEIAGLTSGSTITFACE